MTQRTLIAILATAFATGACDKKTTSTQRGALDKGSSAEAQLQLNAAQKRLSLMQQQTGEFRGGSAELTPATRCCEQANQQCPFDGADWSSSPWSDLGFSPAGPTRFQYSYTASATEVEVRAVADFNCDGNTVEFVLTGAVDQGAATFAVQQL